MNQEPLTRVGDYEVLGVLGTGGMGKVYKVRNVITDRIEAMKILLPNLADRRELGERFLREIRVLAGLNHPNIATLRTALTCENRLLMVMEYVEGVTLATRLQQGPLSPAEAVDYVGQVLEALSYAHRLHIIHRDIKPANMMLTPAGVIKLMDFGIARSQGDPSLTATGTTVGSLHYMSPEQINGRELDERSDLYSLGVSLYEMVTGHRPFEGDSDYALMAAHLQKQPKPPLEMRPDLPPVLNEIILKAMAKDPAQRFQSADAFRAALAGVASSTVAARQADNGDTVRLDDFSPAGAFASAARSQAAPVQEPVMQTPSAPAAKAPTSAEVLPDNAPPVEPPVPKVRVPSVMEMSRDVGNRGLYLTVGAIMLLLAMIAGVLYLPHMRAARSSGKSASVAPPVTPPKPAPAERHSAVPSAASSAMATSVPTPATVPTAPPKPATDEKPPLATAAAPSRAANDRISVPPTPPPATTAHASIPTPPHHGRMADKSAGNPKSMSSGRPQTEERAALSIPAKPAAPDISQLQQLEHELDLLGSRAEAVNASLDGMRQGQAAQGLGLRGDIASSQQRMRTYMGKAQSALKSQDPNATKKYLDLAETEVANLEKFLGR